MKTQPYLLSLSLVVGTLAAPGAAQSANTTATADAGQPIAMAYGQKAYERDIAIPENLKPKPEPGMTPAEIEAMEIDNKRQILAWGIMDEARKHFLKQEGAEPTKAEIDSFIEYSKKTQKEMEKDPMIKKPKKINEKHQIGEDSKAERDVARMMVASWKFNQTLYKKYGGRVIFQQMGYEPIDALKQFLTDLKASGDYEVYVPAYKKGLFKEQEEYFREKHDYVSKADADKYFATPWWLQTPEKDKQ